MSKITITLGNRFPIKANPGLVVSLVVVEVDHREYRINPECLILTTQTLIPVTIPLIVKNNNNNFGMTKSHETYQTMEILRLIVTTGFRTTEQLL
jgi:hypothetical protein